MLHSYSYQFEEFVVTALGHAGDRQVQLAEVVPARRGEEGEDLRVEGLGRVQFHGADRETRLEQKSEK